MTLSQEDLIKLIHKTKAVSIWNRKTGPVFWYIAGVPGPFYVNTELLTGAEISKEILDKITSILAKSPSPEARSAQIAEAVMNVYEKNVTLRNLTEALVDKAKACFSPDSFDLISGGERRDWIFSVPLAKVLGKRHVFLFKDLSLYCSESIKKGEKVLHAADLINNAASYLDLWIPALEKGELVCTSAICVISRGSAGLQKLREKKIDVVALCNIDMPFFEKSFSDGLIDRETLEEIAVHFESPKLWAEKYLMGRKEVFEIPATDSKSFERMISFFNKDPWSLRSKYASFFSEMQTELERNRTA